MLKKKNIAMVMAAATVVTSVAPVFAATLDGETVSKKNEAKIAELKSEIKGYFDTKYTSEKNALSDEDLAGKCVYTITVGGTEIFSSRDLDKAITLLEDGKELSITVTDKGHTTIDGKIVDSKVEKYEKKNVSDIETAVKAVADLKVSTDTDAKAVATYEEVSTNVFAVKLLNNDTTLELKIGSEKIKTEATDVIYKEDAYGNKLDKDGKITTKANDFVVLGFEKARTAILDADKEDVRTFTVNTAESTAANEEYKVSDLYNKEIGALTVKGNELVKFIAKKEADKNVTVDKNDPSSTEFKRVIKYTENGKSYLISISGSKQEITDLDKNLNTPAIKTLAGMNRQETALEVSKEAFTADHSAKNIVLVSDYAIADGLAATPFAKQKDAPILLTSKDGISEDVMKEIKRVLATDGKVFLIGGETVLNQNVESALDSKYIAYERIGGENRQETSLKIAKKMAPAKELFITGRYAEADAMSVANVAATKETPILLTNENELSKEQAKFVKDQAGTTDAYIIGGEAKVTSAVDAQVKELVESNATVKRIAGERRQETNAKVINEFYKGATVDKIYVAKSDDKGLVDALPAGVLAAKDTTPVILATNSLDASQEAVLNKLNINSDAAKTQAGYGIASIVWEQINKIIK